jgi:hypothetical protein
MTTAQNQIKTLLGDTFDVIAEFSFVRKTYRELGMTDEEVIPEIAERSEISVQEVKDIYAALDVYDKYF